MKKTQNSVGYARTSTGKQNIETQLNQFRKIGVPAKQIFYDEGVSGSTRATDRPGFKQLMRFIEHNEIDKLYCFELSRLGRSFLDTLNLVKEFEERGIKVVSLSPSESWTATMQPHFRGLLISIFGWVAENERRMLKERIKIGIERAKEEGKQLGRPEKEPDKKRAMRLRSQGLSWAEVSRVMQIPQSTMYIWKNRWEEEDRVKRIEEIGT
jgi:DNA invertase Pin-like site-specific DNA recombinase